MYNTFECHFKPNQKLQSDMTDPVKQSNIASKQTINLTTSVSCRELQVIKSTAVQMY